MNPSPHDTPQPHLPWSWLGRIAYGQALERQRTWREGVIQGLNPSVLWLLEHDAVVTTGRRPAPGTATPDVLAQHGISYFETERGGLATYHGPGQLVGYLIADVGSLGLGVRDTVEALQDGLIAWLASRGVASGLRPDAPGVWVGNNKIAAIGLHFKRGVSMHGFALNLTTDLAPYRFIIPCGIADAGITSLHLLDPAPPTPEEAAPSVAQAIVAALVPRKLDPPDGVPYTPSPPTP